MQLGSLPAQPKNGVIRTYENQARTFSRPYSAKSVYFYKEGDVFFTGVRIPVSKHRYKTLNSLMEDLNHQMYMPFGVRNITTPMGKTTIESLDQLQHLGKYVASSSKPPRGLDFEKVEKVQTAMRNQRATNGGQSYWVSASPSLPQKMRMSRMLGLNVISAKQVFFVLNGKGKFYRTLINPMKLPLMDQLLEEVSTGLEIIACPRNERPYFQESVKLPEIKPSRYAPRPAHVKTDSLSNTDTSTTTSTRSNGIEKRSKIPALPKQRISQRVVESKITPMTKSPKKRLHGQLNAGKTKQAKEMPGATPILYSSATKLRGETSPTKIDDQDSGAGNSVASSWHTSEASESARPESMTEHKARMIREETNNSQVHSEEDLILEEDDDSVNSGINSRTNSSLNDSAVGKSRETSAEVENGNEGDDDEADDDTLRKYTPMSATETASSGDSKSPEVELPSQNSTSQSNRHQSPKVEEAPSRESTERNGNQTPAAHTPDTERIPTPYPPRTSSDSDREDVLPSDDDDESIEKIEAAATRIQAAFRGFRARKMMKVSFHDDSKEHDDNIESLQDIKNEEGFSMKSVQAGSTIITYTIEVKIGFRYGADTEADLYLIIFGDDAQSQRILLRQEADWLHTTQSKFVEGGIIRFFVESPHLGTLNRVVVGHNSPGYGAGLHIEYIVVSENLLDGRQFLFFVNKWLDGGQVDGKIERTVFLTTFLYLAARPLVQNATTQGRWEFIIHTRRDELGGTTSNLILVGYGDEKNSIHRIENDTMMRDCTMNPLIQVDFGLDLGLLRKVRFEIDGEGDRPNYFIEYIEVRDLDTEERSAVSINKWLMVQPDESTKKYQPFREITIYRKNSQPWPSMLFAIVTTYEGKVSFADTSLCNSEIPKINLQLIGERGQSGVFPVLPATLPSGKIIHSFKIEMVSLGTITEVRVIPEITQLGLDIVCGLNFLQEIYDNHEIPMTVGDQLFVNEVSIRETLHAPFRHIYGLSSIKFEENNAKGPYFKTLHVKVIEGLATTKKTAKGESMRDEDHFVLHMTVEDGENCEIPTVKICSKNGREIQLDVTSQVPIDNVLVYELKTKHIGIVEKIRVGVGEISPGKSVVIHKMRLVEKISGTEVRFMFFAEIREYEVVELTCVYPDVAPRISLLYYISISTKTKKGKFRPYVNIIGSDGDTGFRAYPGDSEFPEATTISMEVEALKLGSLKSIQVYASADNAEDVQWKFSVKVSSEEEKVYQSNDLVLKMAGKKNFVSADVFLIDGPSTL
ncbi:unnamed protein product [Caenorhabditis bovis]|uniref:PLAT domain-containing protein n=1 Tax=Caenorhabditis bovis TaxID=2654633 RepID=A0A8S1F5Y7_9PELO|nr:unnamed protein product [Caenorhabditis bovis]